MGWRAGFHTEPPGVVNEIQQRGSFQTAVPLRRTGLLGTKSKQMSTVSSRNRGGGRSLRKILITFYPQRPYTICVIVYDDDLYFISLGLVFWPGAR